ncbi:MAG TPA: response regulator, partial [Brevibacterium sp.]|nr:response regulator [Brevibacterium sp.]
MDQPLTRPDGSAPRILVVDDEENLAQLLAMAFSYQSWEPRTAGSVQQALTAARQTDFDAAVLDIMLPDGDGVDLMARLRTRDADLPVLFLTAK